MKRIAIIGGGISGLSAAFYLEQARQQGTQLEFSLFEACDRLGGVIKTETVDGCLVESGPDSFLSSKPWAARLAMDVGLQDQFIYSNDFQRKTWIVDRNRLVALPDGVQLFVPTKSWPILTSSLLSFATKMRIAKEYISPPRPLAPDKDESVTSFVTRHFGKEVATKLAAPLLAGIYGGSTDHLSARAVLPQLVAIEAKSRSLARGIMQFRSAGQKIPLFTSFKKGMQQLVDATAKALPAGSLKLNSPVHSISLEGGLWRVQTSAPTESFNHVICATPAFSSADLLQEIDGLLANELRQIQYSASVTVALGYKEDHLAGSPLPNGFGFLVPHREGRSMIACTFVHRKFYFRVPATQLLLRVFLVNEDGTSDQDLQSLVERELAEILNIRVKPDFIRIARWPKALPQYDVGHLDRLERIDQRLAAFAGLQLIGNALRGIGVPDCVREGKSAAEKILREDQA